MPAIVTHNLTRKFGDRVAVDALTCEIRQGEIFGFLGPNGAGKTTTIRILTGLIAPTSGAGTVATYELGVDNDAIRRSVGVLTETPGLYEKLTAEQNLRFYATLYGLSAEQTEHQIQRYLSMLDLADRRKSPVNTYSKGMRQKLAIVRSLIHDPQIVFLDEPTSGLDPEAAGMVRNVIRQVRAEGRTVFLTSHNLAEVDQLCDRIAVFRTRLLHLDTPDNLRSKLFGVQHTIDVGAESARWLEAVQALPYVQQASVDGSIIRVTLSEPSSDKPRLIKALVDAGAPLQNITDQQHSLEDVYLQLIRTDTPAEVAR